MSAVAPLDAALQRLAELEREAAPAERALVVGGAVRDALMGRVPAEADLAVPGDAGAWARRAAQAVGSHAALTQAEHDVHHIPLDGGAIDVVRRQGTEAEDLQRRDFTIDALALPLVDFPGALAAIRDDRVIDIVGGLQDLRAGLVRMTAPEALASDPVRCLRGVRIATELGFELEEKTAAAVRNLAATLAGVAPERVQRELVRVFVLENASAGVRLLEDCGLLSACFPELDAGRGMEQFPNHQYDVFRHQLAALDCLDGLLATSRPADPVAARLWEALWVGGGPLPAPLPEQRAMIGRDPVVLRIATLLHDVGKPATRSVEPDGRTRFFGHAELGAGMVRERLTTLRFPRRQVDRVALLIDQHLRPGQVAPPGEAPSERALYRFHHYLGDAAADLCFLFLADSLATVGPKALLPRWPAYVAHVRRILPWRPAAPADGRRLVDGRTLMRATGLAPGPRLGAILEALDEAAATGRVTTQGEALALAATMLEDGPASQGDKQRDG